MVRINNWLIGYNWWKIQKYPIKISSNLRSNLEWPILNLTSLSFETLTTIHDLLEYIEIDHCSTKHYMSYQVLITEAWMFVFHSKVTNTLNVLKQNLKSTKKVHKKAYKSLVFPQVEYAASIWFTWLGRDNAQIERV